MTTLSAPAFRLKRQAKLLARELKIPLHQALDRVARGEGFRSWSQLAGSLSSAAPSSQILRQLTSGDLVLLGARPRQGKTAFGLELAAKAALDGRQSFFLTLDFTAAEVTAHLLSSGIAIGSIQDRFHLDTSDDLCADRVIEKLRGVSGETVAVIDYLQLMDQKRTNANLADQVRQLSEFLAMAKSIVILISQIDRSFDALPKRLPELSDVRLPNPIDLSLFTKTCFMHEGEIRLESPGDHVEDGGD